MPNMNVPLSDIIDFRQRYEKELRCFRGSLRQCENIEDIQERTKMLQQKMDSDLIEIEELMKYRGIRYARKTMRVLIPIGISAGIDLLELHGKVSPTSGIILQSVVGVAASLISMDESSEIKDSNAYLFYARDNGLIFSDRRR